MVFHQVEKAVPSPLESMPSPCPPLKGFTPGACLVFPSRHSISHLLPLCLLETHHRTSTDQWLFFTPWRPTAMPAGQSYIVHTQLAYWTSLDWALPSHQVPMALEHSWSPEGGGTGRRIPGTLHSAPTSVPSALLHQRYLIHWQCQPQGKGHCPHLLALAGVNCAPSSRSQPASFHFYHTPGLLVRDLCSVEMSSQGSQGALQDNAPFLPKWDKPTSSRAPGARNILRSSLASHTVPILSPVHGRSTQTSSRSQQPANDSPPTAWQAAHTNPQERQDKPTFPAHIPRAGLKAARLHNSCSPGCESGAPFSRARRRNPLSKQHSPLHHFLRGDSGAPRDHPAKGNQEPAGALTRGREGSSALTPL